MKNPEAASNPVNHLAQRDVPSDTVTNNSWLDFNFPDMTYDFDTQMQNLMDVPSVLDGADDRGVYFTQDHLHLGMEEIVAADVLHRVSNATQGSIGVIQDGFEQTLARSQVGIDEIIQGPALTIPENHHYQRSRYSTGPTLPLSGSRTNEEFGADFRNFPLSPLPEIQDQALCDTDIIPQGTDETRGHQVTVETPDKLPSPPYGYHRSPIHAHIPAETDLSVLTRAQTRALAFSSLAQAEAAMTARHIDMDWRSPENDESFPRTSRESSVYVAQLLDAMEDTTQCKDKRGAPAFKNRWADDARQPYKPEQMEKVCWDLLNIAEQLHAFGPSSLSIYDIEVLSTVRKSRKLTFGERIYSISALLRLSKNRCFMLMKGDGLAITVGAPAQRLSESIINHEQNDKRQKLIVAGREAGIQDLEIAHNDLHNAEGDAGAILIPHIDGNPTVGHLRPTSLALVNTPRKRSVNEAQLDVIPPSAFKRPRTTVYPLELGQ